MFITLGLALLWTCTRPSEPSHPWFLVSQLFFGSMLLQFLDDLLNSYGLCSAYILMIAASQFRAIIWHLISPITVDKGRGPEFEGSLFAVLQLLVNWESPTQALREAFFRSDLPNLKSVLATLFIYAAILYLHKIRADIPVKSKITGQNGTYPIELVTASTHSLLLSHVTLSFRNRIDVRYVVPWSHGLSVLVEIFSTRSTRIDLQMDEVSRDLGNHKLRQNQSVFRSLLLDRGTYFKPVSKSSSRNLYDIILRHCLRCIR
jgi:preprotein translocase subunit SecY